MAWRGREGSWVSEQQLEVSCCHGRQSWTGVCQGKLCPDVGEAAPCLMNGFLHVARAGHLRWFLDQGRRRISVVSTRRQGTCCQGVPRQGSMPASTS